MYSSIVQRFHFNSCIQKESETVMQYVAELRKLSEYCEFGTRLTPCCGTGWCVEFRMYACSAGYCFSKVFDLAVAAELAEKNGKDLQSTGTSTQD